MPREDYINIDVGKIITDIGNNWTSEDDLKIKKDSSSYNKSIALKGILKSEIHKASMSISNLGKKHSEEHKVKISKGLIGRIFSDETRNKLSILKKKENLSDETRNKLSLAGTGRPISDKTRKIFIENNSKKRSEEFKKKVSLKQKGRIVSKETLDKRLKTLGIKPIIFNGIEYQTIADAARKLGIPATTFRARYKKSLKNND